jgi:transcription elongation factor GreA
MQKVPITAEGFRDLEIELRELKTVARPDVIQAIAEAREHGDLSENAEYHAAKEKQGFIETRVIELEDKISRADVIEASQMTGDTIKFGATISLVDEDTDEESVYRIVGEDEAEIRDGKLSFASPLARSLIGKETGDRVEVTTPRGSKAYEILNVAFV